MPSGDCVAHPLRPSRVTAPRCTPAPALPVARSTFFLPFGGLSIQYREDRAQVALHRFDRLRIQCRPGNGPQLPALLVLVDLLPCSIDRVFLGVEQLLHQHDQLDLAALVDPVSGAVFRRVEELELALPVAKYVRLQVGERAHVADGKELLDWLLRFHPSTSALSSLVMSAEIALRAGWPSNSTRFTVSTIGMSTSSRAARSRARCAVATPSATVSWPTSASSSDLPFPSSTPTARVRLSDPVQVRTRSPSPASPAIVLCSAPIATPSLVISASPLVMRAARALKPRPNPSAIPVATAITFLSAPPSSTPMTSVCVYTLK